MKVEDGALIDAAIAGDELAKENIIKAYEKQVYNIALRVLLNEQDAHDAAQETLIKVYLKIGDFRHTCALSSWIYKMCVNTCIDLMRKKKGATVPIDEGVPLATLKTSDVASDPVLSLSNTELKEKLMKALKSLEAEQRTAVILKDVRGYSYEEIAVITGANLGTVKSRLFRAREKLKVILSE